MTHSAELKVNPCLGRWGQACKHRWVDSGRVLGIFSERVSQALREYKDFIHEAIGEGRKEGFYRAIGQQILGGDKFLEEVESKIGRVDRPLRKPSLQQILGAVKEVTGISEDDLFSRGRSKEVIFARGVFGGVWREFGYRLVDLQPILRRDLSVLSRLSKITGDDKRRQAVERVCKILNARMQA